MKSCTRIEPGITILHSAIAIHCIAAAHCISLPPSLSRNAPTMPSDDYISAVGGGLKLKGGAPAGVKKKKKKKKTQKDISQGSTAKLEKNLEDMLEETADELKQGEGAADQDKMPEEAGDDREDEDGERGDGKTETERRYEEMRRRRLDERLRKEGVKTHKERVEGLNKYLSTLSEHHDMPRIGPG